MTPNLTQFFVRRKLQLENNSEDSIIMCVKCTGSKLIQFGYGIS